MQKNPQVRKYKLSKVIFLILLFVSLIADIILGLAAYEWLKSILSDPASLAIVAFIVSSVLGAILYLIDRWQIEFLTGNKE